ncbi:hypothetical protein [Sphingobium ummariense]
MSDGVWIYVPEEGEGKAWTGRVWSDADGLRRWRFEVVRSVNHTSLYGQGVFDGAKPVTALLDHQRPATLLRPIVTTVDPGKIGMTHPWLRTRLEGSFQALLTGKAVTDEHEPLFSGVGFESASFSAWYGGRIFSETHDSEYRTRSIEVGEPQTEKIVISGIGELEAIRQAHVASDHASSQVRALSILRINFDRMLSLSEAMDLSLGLELVFGFLVGFRPEPPTFHLWWPPHAEDESSEIRDAELELGGVHFRSDKSPHPFNCVHVRGRDGAGLKQVVAGYAANPSDIVNRIHAIQIGRWFGSTLNDKFAAVMPIFEECLKAKYRLAPELTYMEEEAKFFAYVDSSGDPDLIEFSKKHLEVKDRKSPSLSTLIGRALDELNAAGFRFDLKLASRIAKRRATMFHSAPLMSDNDVREFYMETRAVTAALMLLTLRDLAVDISQLPQAYNAMNDFTPFMPEMPPPRLTDVGIVNADVPPQTS